MFRKFDKDRHGMFLCTHTHKHTYIHEHIQMFRKFDKDQDGTISRDEFKAGIHDMHLGLTEEVVEGLAEHLDPERYVRAYT